MYWYSILLLASLVLPILAAPLTASVVSQNNDVVERSDHSVRATILPSLPKRESTVGLLPVRSFVSVAETADTTDVDRDVDKRDRRPVGGFGHPKRSAIQMEERKDRRPGGFGNPKRSDNDTQQRERRPVDGFGPSKRSTKQTEKRKNGTPGGRASIIVV